MTKKERDMCHMIIHSASAASAAAGFIPLPGSDAVTITAAQVSMIIALGKVFDVRLSESAAEAMALTLLTPHIGKMVASGLVKLIPGIGQAINASVALSITEAVGWEVAEDFAKQAEAARCADLV